MGVEISTSGAAGAGNPAGAGAAASAPVVDQAVIDAAVAKATAGLPDMVTGAVKRQVASAVERALADAKGNPDAPKTGDDKVSSEKVKNTELNERLKKIEAENARNLARAIRGNVTEAVVKAKVHEHARELLVNSLASLAKETDKGELVVEGADGPIPLVDYLAGYLKGKPGLLESAARPGSDSGGSTASQFRAAMPKTQAELMYSVEKNAGGYDTVRATPTRLNAFIDEFGLEALDALPMGRKPAGLDAL